MGSATVLCQPLGENIFSELFLGNLDLMDDSQQLFDSASLAILALNFRRIEQQTVIEQIRGSANIVGEFDNQVAENQN